MVGYQVVFPLLSCWPVSRCTKDNRLASRKVDKRSNAKLSNSSLTVRVRDSVRLGHLRALGELWDRETISPRVIESMISRKINNNDLGAIALLIQSTLKSPSCVVAQGKCEIPSPVKNNCSNKSRAYTGAPEEAPRRPH